LVAKGDYEIREGKTGIQRERQFRTEKLVANLPQLPKPDKLSEKKRGYVKKGMKKRINRTLIWRQHCGDDLCLEGREYDHHPDLFDPRGGQAFEIQVD